MEISVNIKRKPEIIAGIFFLLTGFSIIFSLLTNIEFLSAFSSLSDDIEYLTENKSWLQLNSFLWIVSAFLITLLAASLITALVPHQSFLGYLNGSFLLISAAMFCIAGIKGLSVNVFLKNSIEAELLNPDILKANIYFLSREKDIYLKTAYILIGLSFFVIGIFSFITSKLPFLAGIFSTITGIMIIVFNLFIHDSILADAGLVMACCMFFIFTIRFLFRGLEKKRKKGRRKKSSKKVAEEPIVRNNHE